MATLGLIGSGNIGGTLARLAVDAGLDVVLSNSRGPQTLAGLVAELGPRARAATPAEAAEAGDWVVVTVPLKNYLQIPAGPLAKRTVLDTNNYYPERDSSIARLDAQELTSSELLQEHLADSSVVKAFNNIYFGHLASLARPAGSADRTALPIAGDDPAAKERARALLDALGFDAVDAGSLADSWRFEPGAPAYGLPYVADPGRPFNEDPGKPADAATITTALSAAKRPPAA
ncbi:putative dinucleotide-binding enzyme [Kitasatospora sp. MAP12-15]|uniref:NADPH-dependent F420 reductase n=1 Tax=unclassified Kitasatospora TaxID=2633591 RepID=UPI0024764305|nr:NAD(P)-binding domain-containing protein [Kitasatospora sp. MAP12-44]MDH6114948.1 putative dinucleotide-binding enzyme [Kitasatospora sp. MAP12-44]